VSSDAARAEVRQALDASWRAGVEGMQTAALPPGSVTVSCSAPFGVGGLGRHLQEIAAALQRRGEGSCQCVCEPGGAARPPRPCREVHPGALSRARLALARPSQAWRIWAASVGFDSAAARALPVTEHLISFNGTSLAQFRAARAARFVSLSVMSATSHMRRVLRQAAIAHRQYPLERPWPTHLLARNLREYAAADRIYVSSRYSWQSFVEEGFSEDALSLFPLTPDPRFGPVAAGAGEGRAGAPGADEAHAGGPGAGAAAAPATGSFDVVYAGALTVQKGVPLLVDAIRRLPFSDLRLMLLGGWKTRGMRRFIEATTAADARISVYPGDPLRRVRAAALCVHPSYQDGFAYAPAEALACGVPVIVSEDTGMKDLIASERHGLVLPTGQLDPLTEAIGAAYRRQILPAAGTRTAS
jgi:glycosyltransferase involved in cell wall biosynthesis